MTDGPGPTIAAAFVALALLFFLAGLVSRLAPGARIHDNAYRDDCVGCCSGKE